jgi:SAM-dependent methyltransferase
MGLPRPARPYTRDHVADLPFDLDPGLAEQLAGVLDVEGKIPRALDALGPIGGRDVVLVDGTDGIRARQLRDLGGRVTLVDPKGPAPFDVPADSADVLVAAWSAFRGAPRDELAQADRILRPDGRLLVVQDYGRDDVTRLVGEPAEPLAWSKRDGPYLSAGFKVRVIHCFWTFPSIEDAGAFLSAAFGDAGRTVHAAMTRPRITYNVAVFHRTFGATAKKELA